MTYTNRHVAITIAWVLTAINAGSIPTHDTDDNLSQKTYHPPIEATSEKQRLYIECRGNKLYRVPLEELKIRADESVRNITTDNTADKMDIFRQISEITSVRNDDYVADMSTYLTGHLILEPLGEEGYPLISKIESGGEPESGWYRKILNEINSESQVISFLVRDDSFAVFYIARELAWKEGIDVAYKLLPFSTNNRISSASVNTPVMLKGMSSVIAGDYLKQDDAVIDVTYVDVHRDRIIIFPDNEVVPLAELGKRGNPFEELLNRIEGNKSAEYIVFFLRPQTGHIFSRLRSMVKSRGIDLGYELKESGQEIKF